MRVDDTKAIFLNPFALSRIAYLCGNFFARLTIRPLSFNIIQMRAIVQRVKNAKVTVDGKTVGQIEAGMLVYLGIGKGDSEDDAVFMADKIANLRIFADANDKMNLSVKDTSGQLLIVSNFTLFGDCRKGRRPGFDLAAEPATANKLYEKVAELIRQEGIEVQNGVFAANMQVYSQNDGPINFLLDSEKLF